MSICLDLRHSAIDFASYRSVPFNMVDFYSILEEVSRRLLQITLGNRFRLYLTVLQTVSCLSHQSSFKDAQEIHMPQLKSQIKHLQTT